MERNHLVIGTCDQCGTENIKLEQSKDDELYRCLSCRKIHERKDYAEQLEKDREKTKRRFQDWTN